MRNRFAAQAGAMLALLAISAVGNAGTIYRCAGDHGEVAYSQHPCGTRAQTRIDPIQHEGARRGLRDGEKALLRQYEKRTRRSTTTRRIARPQGKAKSAYACRQKKRALDAVRNSLRRGYKPARGEKLRRRRRAYEDYLSTFCS